MAKSTRERKYVRVITRRIVAENLRQALKHRYGDRKNHPGLLKNEFGITISQTARVLEGSMGVSIDWLEQVAFALDMSVVQFFIPSADIQRQMTVPEDVASSAAPQMLIPRGEHTPATAPILKPKRIAR